LQEKLIDKTSVLKDIKEDREDKEDKIVLLVDSKIIFEALLHNNRVNYNKNRLFNKKRKVFLLTLTKQCYLNFRRTLQYFLYVDTIYFAFKFAIFNYLNYLIYDIA